MINSYYHYLQLSIIISHYCYIITIIIDLVISRIIIIINIMECGVKPGRGFIFITTFCW